LLLTDQAGGVARLADAGDLWREGHGGAPRGGAAPLGGHPRRATPHAPGSDSQRSPGGARPCPEGVLRPMKQFSSVAAYPKPLPAALVRKLVKARVAQNEAAR